MSAPRLVLSTFPGVGLLDLAFERAGFIVVRGPDAIWGGDVKRFHVPPGIFEGLIGGPPCQVHSSAIAIAPGSSSIDLIPEFVRVYREGAFAWVLMENVPGARRAGTVPPEWYSTALRDWDCGGHTARRRVFWSYPFSLMRPGTRSGTPSLSVLASTAKKGVGQYAADKRFLPGNTSLSEIGRLSGCPEIVEALERFGFSKSVIVRLIGNGVPLALGEYVARQCWQYGGAHAE